MTDEEFKDAKVLWQMVYSKDCFKRAREAAQEALRIQLPEGHPLYRALMTGIFVLYARPFTHNRGVGQLDEKMIPEEAIGVHRNLLLIRHKAYAHMDATEPTCRLEEELARLVFFRRKGDAVRLQNDDICSKLISLEQRVIPLCGTLEQKCDYHAAKLYNRYRLKVPREDGSYTVNILDKDGPFFIAEERPDKEFSLYEPGE